VYRWERDESAPSKRHRAALVTAFKAVSPEIGAWFADATASPAEGAGEAAGPAAPAAPSGAEVLERAVFLLADELDLPPRRAREAAPEARLIIEVDGGYHQGGTTGCAD